MRDLDEAFRSSDRSADLRDQDVAEERQAARPPGFGAALQRRVMQRRAARAQAASLQTEATATEAPQTAAPQTAAPQTGHGEALPEPVRGKMERAFDTSFDDVSVHQGDQAERAGAAAYAQGSELHFAPGQYAPGTRTGDELIGHELTHVVQQRAGRVAAPQQHKGGVNDDPALEAEADTMGARAAAGEQVAMSAGAGSAGSVTAGAPVQRKLTLGKAGGPDPQRVVDLAHVEGLVAEVIALNDATLMTAATKASADQPHGAIRDAILVLYRNDRRFDTMPALIAAVTERLTLIQNVAAVDWDSDVADITVAHPEHAAFARALEGLAEPAKIEALWTLTIEGVRFQKDLNAQNRRAAPNPHYHQLAQELGALLDAGGKPALWSGGYDVSMYAQNRGYRTLEVTAAGKMFDQLKLFRDFSTLGPLWNAISTKFVSSFTGEAHVFVRTVDKSKVLFRQELTEAVRLDGLQAMKWHVMKGTDLSTLAEVDGSGKPTPGHTFDGYRAAATAMSADAFRAPTGEWAIKGEPETAEGVHDKMVEEQQQVPVYTSKLKEFVDGRARSLKVDGPSFQPRLERLKDRAELRLKNDPALGVDLADLFAEIKDDLAKDIAHLARA
jgi:hypothetical protein